MTTPQISDTVDVQVLYTILSNLVTAPEDIKIERKIDEQGVLLSVVVNSKDMGIVIGRNGSMATSIKSIMRAVGKANQMTIRIQFLEPDGTVKYSAVKNTNTSFSLDAEMDASLDEDLKDFVIN
jgi:uncharacterized protein